MYTTILNEEDFFNDFVEVRDGAFNELKAKFKKIEMLHQHYETELGADRVTQIHAEVNVKLAELQSGDCFNSFYSEYFSCIADTTTSSEQMTNLNDSSMNTEPVATATSAELAEVGGFESAVFADPLENSGHYSNIADVTTSSEQMPSVNDLSTNTEPVAPGTSAELVEVGSHVTFGCGGHVEVNKNTNESASSHCDEGDEVEDDVDVDLKIPLDLLELRWNARMEVHRRSADSYDEMLQKRFNCVCGYSDLRLHVLETHMKRAIFGDVFKCPKQYCSTTYGYGRFHMFKNHCKERHQITITNEAGCYMCGIQFKTEGVPLWHKSKCPGRSVLQVAMTIKHSM